MDNNNKHIGFGGSRIGGKTGANINLLKSVFKTISEEGIEPIECPNCENHFFIVAHPRSSWPRAKYYSEGKEQVGLLVRSEAWYKDFIKEPLPEDSCHWHE